MRVCELIEFLRTLPEDAVVLTRCDNHHIPLLPAAEFRRTRARVWRDRDGFEVASEESKIELRDAVVIA